jgi:hypothetical protein
MRQRFTWLASAGLARWPEDAQVEGGVSLRPFSWVKIDNRGANDVIVGVSNPSFSDRDYLVKVKAGKMRVFNVRGPVRPAPAFEPVPGDAPPEVESMPHELHLQVAAAGVTTCLIETDDSPIVDMIWTI